MQLLLEMVNLNFCFHFQSSCRRGLMHLMIFVFLNKRLMHSSTHFAPKQAFVKICLQTDTALLFHQNFTATY